MVKAASYQTLAADQNVADAQDNGLESGAMSGMDIHETQL
jgi:hypothetical protein